ncbi:hypothetical protein EA472_11725 [Natrarchaeobius oligotrophus]|uniref:Uncharacterized protein n=1 Tax=Natrarchaeobius chitinivorans TaxID=1679083 RepID=A0A3N6MCS2_NATCH|nr:hypothetical protein EA472_11725 [Natrarchaeobius chitinivorans]
MSRAPLEEWNFARGVAAGRADRLDRRSRTRTHGARTRMRADDACDLEPRRVYAFERTGVGQLRYSRWPVRLQRYIGTTGHTTRRRRSVDAEKIESLESNRDGQRFDQPMTLTASAPPIWLFSFTWACS